MLAKLKKVLKQSLGVKLFLLLIFMMVANCVRSDDHSAGDHSTAM